MAAASDTWQKVIKVIDNCCCKALFKVLRAFLDLEVVLCNYIALKLQIVEGYHQANIISIFTS